MPKKRIRRHDQYEYQDQEPDPDNQATWKPDPQETIIDPEDAELDEVFKDFPQNEACIELYRINQQGGHPRFLERMMPSIFNFAYVTEKYGGGKYQAKGKYKNGARVKLPFEVEGDPFPVKRILPKEPVTVDANPTGPFSQQLETVIERDPNAAFVSLFKAMLTEMKNSETMLLEKMRMWKEIFAPQAKQETPLDTALTMFQKGLEMSAMMEGGNSNPWLFLIRELKEPLTKIVDTVQMAVNRPPMIRPQPAPGTPGPSLPIGTTSSPASGSQAPPEPHLQPNVADGSSGDVMLLQLKAVLPLLINGAAKNTDPMTYVDFVLDQLPASAYDSFRTWLLKPDCLDELAQIEPGIRFQQEWWTALRSGLLEALQEELGYGVSRVHPGPDSNPTTEPSDDHDSLP